MTLPTYDQFIEPLLRHLAEHPGGVSTVAAYSAIARALRLDEPQRLESLPSGSQPVYKNRVGWANDRLKRQGLSESPRRGQWQITRAGIDFVKRHPAPLTSEQSAALATIDRASSLRGVDPSDPGKLDTIAPGAPPHVKSPDDRLQEALDELNETVARELLDVIGRSFPQLLRSPGPRPATRARLWQWAK